MNPTRTQALGVNRPLRYLKGSKHIRIDLGMYCLERMNLYFDSSWSSELAVSAAAEQVYSYDQARRQFKYAVYCKGQS